MQWITMFKAILKTVCTPSALASCAGYEKTLEIDMTSSVCVSGFGVDSCRRQAVVTDHRPIVGPS